MSENEGAFTKEELACLSDGVDKVICSSRGEDEQSYDLSKEFCIVRNF